MTNFEIAATAYSVVSTLGLVFTACGFRAILDSIEKRIHARVSDEVKSATLQARRDASCIRNYVMVSEQTIKAQAEEIGLRTQYDIARVEKWITEHAEELKARAEDLRVRALDLHDKTQAGPTRQPPTRS